MFKLMWLMKRKEGTTFQAFQDYYEKHHAKLGLRIWKQMGLFPRRYARRYLHQPAFLRPQGVSAEVPEPPFDVATEIWFDSQAHFETFMQSVPEAAIALFEEDELKFLDREKSVLYLIDERETELDPIPQAEPI